MITADQVKYLGSVARWLQDAPEGKFTYGEFYASELTIKFDGEPAGVFIHHDETWNYYAEDEDRPRLLESGDRDRL